MKISKTYKYSHKFWVQKSALKSLLKPLHRVTPSDRPPPGEGGCTPYIRMIGMIVVFLGIVIGDLVFFRGCSSKIL